MDPRPGTPFGGDEVPNNKILEAFADRWPWPLYRHLH